MKIIFVLIAVLFAVLAIALDDGNDTVLLGIGVIAAAVAHFAPDNRL